MLETLVPSRIRRALFEHILAHPQERFYLRGLAKRLSLSVSPLRRELMRLERAGLFKVVQEGSLRFYAVDTTSPVFLQLQSAGQQTPGEQTEAPSPAVPPHIGAGQGGLPLPRPRRALRGPALVAATALGLVLVLGAAGFFYSRMIDRRLASRVLRPAETRTTVTVVVPQGSGSGVMRGRQWQVVPGGFGGFGSSSTGEAY